MARWVLTFMGACTPGAFFFLFALITETNVHFETPVWLLLAAAGGFGGHRLARHLTVVSS